MDEINSAASPNEGNGFETSTNEDENIENTTDDSEQSNLFVGDLCKECTEEELCNIFSQYGEVTEVLIKRSKVTMNPLGYGFVKMATLEAAKYCIDHLNDTVIGDRPIRVGWAKRNCKLQITFQDTSLTVEDINTAFGAYGEIYEDETVLHRLLLPEGNFHNIDEVTAVIHYKKREAAEAAKRNCISVNLRCKPVLVEWSHNANNKNLSTKSRLQRLPLCLQNTSYISNKYMGAGGVLTANSFGAGIGYIDSPVVSIYVRFETVEENSNISETTFYEVFQKYGRVTVVAIKTSLKDPTTGITSGYAFIHYDSSDTGRESAVRAVNATNGVVIDGILYTAELSRNFRRGTMEETYVSSGGATTTGSSTYSLSPIGQGQEGSMMMMPYNMSGHGGSSNGSIGGSNGYYTMNAMGGYPPQATASSNPYWITSPYSNSGNNNNNNNNNINGNIDLGYGGYSSGSYAPCSYSYSSNPESYYAYPKGVSSGGAGGGGGGGMGGGRGAERAARRGTIPSYQDPHQDMYSQQLPSPYLPTQQQQQQQPPPPTLQQSYMGHPYPTHLFTTNTANTAKYFPNHMGAYPLAPGAGGGYWQQQPSQQQLSHSASLSSLQQQMYYGNHHQQQQQQQPVQHIYSEGSQTLSEHATA